jgi:hypothetical protein
MGLGANAPSLWGKSVDSVDGTIRLLSSLTSVDYGSDRSKQVLVSYSMVVSVTPLAKIYAHYSNNRHWFKDNEYFVLFTFTFGDILSW